MGLPWTARRRPHTLLGMTKRSSTHTFLLLPVLLSACRGEVWVEQVSLPEGDYWLVIPRALPEGGVPGVVHLHHSGDGQSLAEDAQNQAELVTAGLIGIFPMGGGEPGDDWRVGRNKDDIPRDDRAFLADVARDVEAREALSGLWLSGFSKGGAMVYDYACLGEPSLYQGFLPMAGAFQDWVPEDCSHPAAPIRHLQGSADHTWPRTTAEDPDSSHEGILDSLQGLNATDDTCLQSAPDVASSETMLQDVCEIWSGCPVDVRLCVFEGGHTEPAGWLLGHGDWIQLTAP